ncbi:hypothetical protein Tagg_1050 [Thermosphaera aggregans DSM 11486]|uniref:Uncharacterized protein n=1 Tax=Thermosphaera aggregans (strain DSM 11486 / M11TL) TaxID=633148 RepID=D5U2G9_THEAM|nr:hypothetical protein Tagg_1050 [Thermosphaera aggregans DSM 11486]
MFFTLIVLLLPLAIFITEIFSSNGGIIGVEPIRDGDYCGIEISYQGSVRLNGFTLRVNQSEIVIGDLEKGSVKTVILSCDEIDEPDRFSFTIAGLYPFEIKLNPARGQP